MLTTLYYIIGILGLSIMFYELALCGRYVNRYTNMLFTLQPDFVIFHRRMKVWLALHSMFSSYIGLLFFVFSAMHLNMVQYKVYYDEWLRIGIGVLIFIQLYIFFMKYCYNMRFMKKEIKEEVSEDNISFTQEKDDKTFLKIFNRVSNLKYKTLVLIIMSVIILSL